MALSSARSAAASRRSPRIETLEPRQLLATVAGSGVEVEGNIRAPNGNVYDQVLMTGQDVTIGLTDAEIAAHQVVRVSFLDPTGDITQIEFSGPGTLTVHLDAAGYRSHVQPADYRQTIDYSARFGPAAVGYVQGLASLTISGADATSNLGIYSVGPGNAFNPGALFDDAHGGGNHTAEIAHVTILDDHPGVGGSTFFGGIRTGNVTYAAPFGEVGITATGVKVSGPVVIGDIDALAGSSNAVLRFGAASAFGNVVIAGGDLQQTNGAAIRLEGIGGSHQLVLQAGASSAVDNGQPRFGRATAVNPALPDKLTPPLAANARFVDAVSGQASTPPLAYNAMDVTIDGTGDLSRFANTVLGNVTITGGLTDQRFLAARIGSLKVIGNVVNSLISTDGLNLNGTNITTVNDADIFLPGGAGKTAGIGDIEITGDFTNSRVESLAGFGNIHIAGNVALTAATDQQGKPLVAFGNTDRTQLVENRVAFQSYDGGAGTLTIDGTLAQSLADSTLLATAQGTVGALSFARAVTQTAGTLVAADDSFDGALAVTIGDVRFGTGGSVLNLATVVDQTPWSQQAAKAGIGNITSAGSLTLGGVALTHAGLGNIAVDHGDLTLADGSLAGLSAATVGGLSANNITVQGAVLTPDSLGAIAAAGNLIVTAAGSIVAEGSIGSITAAKSIAIAGRIAAGNGIGDLVAQEALLVTGRVSTSAGSIGNLSANAIALSHDGSIISAGAIGAITSATDVTIASGSEIAAVASIGSVRAQGGAGSATGLSIAGVLSAGTSLGDFVSNRAMTIYGLVSAGRSIGDLIAGDAFNLFGVLTTSAGEIGNISGSAVLVAGNASIDSGAAIGAISGAIDVTIASGATVRAATSIGNISTRNGTSGNTGINIDGVLAAGTSIGGLASAAAMNLAGAVSAGVAIGDLTAAGALTLSGTVHTSDGPVGNLLGESVAISGTLGAHQLSSPSTADIGSIAASRGGLTLAAAGRIEADGSIGTVSAIGGSAAISGLISAGGNIGLISAPAGNVTIAAGTGKIWGRGATSFLDGVTAAGNLTIDGTIRSDATASSGGIGGFQVTGQSSRLVVSSSGVIETTGAGSIGNFTATDAALTIAGTVTTHDVGDIGNFTTGKGTITVSGTIATGTTGDIGDFLVASNADAVNANVRNFVLTPTGVLESGRFSDYTKDQPSSAVSALLLDQGSIGSITASGLTLQGTIRSANDIGLIWATNNALDTLAANGVIVARGSDSRIAGLLSAGGIDLENKFDGSGLSIAADHARNTFAATNDTDATNDNGIGSIVALGGDIRIRASGKLSANLSLAQDFNGSGSATADDVDFTTGTVGIIHAVSGSVTIDPGSAIRAGRIGNIVATQAVSLAGNLTAADGQIGALCSTAGSLTIAGAIDAHGTARDLTGGANRTTLLSVSGGTVLETAAAAALRGDIGFNLDAAPFRQASDLHLGSAFDLTLTASGRLSATDDIGAITSNQGAITAAAASVIEATGADSAISGFFAGHGITFAGSVASAGTGLALGLASAGNVFAKVSGSGSIALTGPISATGGGSIGDIATSNGSILIGGAISTTGTGSIGNFTAGGDLKVGESQAGSITSYGGHIGNFTAAGNLVVGGAADGSISSQFGGIGNFTADANHDGSGGIAIGTGAGAGTIRSVATGDVGSFATSGAFSGHVGIQIGARGAISSSGALGAFVTTTNPNDIVSLSGHISTNNNPLGRMAGFNSSGDIALTGDAASVAIFSAAEITEIVANGSLAISGVLTTPEQNSYPATIAAMGGIGKLAAIHGGITLAHDGYIGITGDLGAITAGTSLSLVDGGTFHVDGNIGNITAPVIAFVDGPIRRLQYSSGRIEAVGSIGNITASGSMTLGSNSVITAEQHLGAIAVGSDATTINLRFGPSSRIEVGGNLRTSANSIGNITITGGVLGTDGTIEFLAGSIGDITIIGNLPGALVTDAIFQANSYQAPSSAENQIGNIWVQNKNLAATSSLFASTSPALSAASGVGFAAEGRIAFAGGTAGRIVLQSGLTQNDGRVFGTGTLISGTATGLLIASGDSDFGGSAGTPKTSGTMVEMGKLQLFGNFAAPLTTSAGRGLFITSGVNPTTAGSFYDGTKATVGLVGVNSSIAGVEIWNTAPARTNLVPAFSSPTATGGAGTHSIIAAAQFGAAIKEWNQAFAPTIGSPPDATLTLLPTPTQNTTAIDCDNDSTLDPGEIVIVRV